MTTPNEELINNLTIKAGVMEMGEKIAWGSDTALMRQAAATLQSQAERIKELEAEAEQLRTAAQAVIDRWDTPHWKDVPATAEYIGRLRAALGEKS